MGSGICESRLPCREVLLILGFLAIGSVQARVSAVWEFRSAGHSQPTRGAQEDRDLQDCVVQARGGMRGRRGQGRSELNDRMQCSKDSETWALHPSMVHWPTRGAGACVQRITASQPGAALRCCCAGPRGRKPSGLALKEERRLISWHVVRCCRFSTICCQARKSGAFSTFPTITLTDVSAKQARLWPDAASLEASSMWAS